MREKNYCRDRKKEKGRKGIKENGKRGTIDREVLDSVV